MLFSLSPQFLYPLRTRRHKNSTKSFILDDSFLYIYKAGKPKYKVHFQYFSVFPEKKKKKNFDVL